MGIGPGYKCKSSGWTGSASIGNPNPKNYKIIKAEEVNGNLVIMINYPDCTNYEGNKILVYRHTRLTTIVNMVDIDPHFSENKLGPIARFEPTQLGWIMAIRLAHTM